MNETELKEKIKSIDDQLKPLAETIKVIDTLKKERTKLKSQLDKMETSKLPFEQQFQKWVESPRKGKYDDSWIPDEDTFPALREMMDKNDYHRYETIYIKDEFEWEAVYGEGAKDDYIAENGEDKYELLVKAAKEIMHYDLSQFKYDW